MSFRGRLTVFFVAIVVVPMIAVAVLVVQITEDSREGKADARLAAGLETASVTYDRALLRASEEVEQLARSPEVAAALQSGDQPSLTELAGREISSQEVAAVSFLAADGRALARAGPADALAFSRKPVEIGDERIGLIKVAVLDPEAYAEEVATLTGVGVVIASAAGELAATIDSGGASLPVQAEGRSLQLPDGEARAATLSLDGAPPGSRLVLVSATGEGFVASEPLVAGILVAFFGIAALLALLLMRMLQGQISAMLAAARRIGSGDFSQKVPVEGHDEMAGLASEFNKMSERLERQLGELRRQREELDQSVRRIGEAFASGLDRTALLEIVIETGLAACEAESGQIALRGHEEVDAEAGRRPEGEVAEALESARAEAVQRGSMAESSVGGAAAIAQPLTRAGGPGAVTGTMALARRGEPFGPAEREVLRYLIGQAAISIENIGLHERVTEQAVTDELTGLPNNRHFWDWIDREAARLGRFGGDLSLMLIDLDNFKAVNDSYGHLQGDEVLEALGRMLRLESRGVDEPARYGGEEFVLALPGTPKQGAVEVAERVRERIERTPIDGVDGNAPLSVTASIGVATMPTDASEPQALLAAADAALYRAKSTGKNRVVAAGGG